MIALRDPCKQEVVKDTERFQPKAATADAAEWSIAAGCYCSPSRGTMAKHHRVQSPRNASSIARNMASCETVISKEGVSLSLSKKRSVAKISVTAAVLSSQASASSSTRSGQSSVVMSKNRHSVRRSCRSSRVCPWLIWSCWLLPCPKLRWGRGRGRFCSWWSVLLPVTSWWACALHFGASPWRVGMCDLVCRKRPGLYRLQRRSGE